MKKLTAFVVVGLVILVTLLGVLILLLTETTSEITPEWVRSLPDEPDWWVATSFTECNGDIFVLGYTGASVFGMQELYISAYNSEGEMIWEEIWGTPEFDRAYEITSYGDSLYIVGYTRQLNSDALLLCYNSNGNVEWSRTWDANNSEIGKGIAVYDDHIYLTGDIQVNARYENSFICKFDLQGNLIWSEIFSNPGRNMLFEITGYDNHLYIVGSTRNQGTWDYYDVLLKYDIDGNFIWNRTWFIGNAFLDWTRGLLVYYDGIYVVGTTYTYEEPRVYLTRYDFDGSEIWNKTWVGVSDSRNYGRGICSYKETLFVIGKTTMNTTYNTDVVLLEYDTEGKLLSSKTWGSDYREEAIDIIESNDFLYIMGYTYENGRTIMLKVGTFDIPLYWGAFIIIFGIILVIIVDVHLISRSKKNQKDSNSLDSQGEEQEISPNTLKNEGNELIDEEQ